MRLMNFNTQTFCLAAVVLSAVACGGDSSSSSSPALFEASTRTIDSRQEAESLAVQLLGGRVLTSEEDVERGRDVYEVEVMRETGSVVEIEIEVSTGRVLEVEGDSLAEGDDLNVGEGLLTLREAIAIALEGRSGAVVEWEIERDEDDAGWEWEIVIRDGQGDESEVEIDAETGEAEVDEDGDDNEPWDRDDIDEDDSSDELPASIEAAALAMVSGTIESAERDDSEGFSSWSIDVRTTSGAEVDVELLAGSGRLYEADGSEGPFDYAFTPTGYLTLAQALSAASIGPNDIDEWSLDRDDDRMTYDFELIDGDSIEVDALDGTVIDD